MKYSELAQYERQIRDAYNGIPDIFYEAKEQLSAAMVCIEMYKAIQLDGEIETECNNPVYCLPEPFEVYTADWDEISRLDMYTSYMICVDMRYYLNDIPDCAIKSFVKKLKSSVTPDLIVNKDTWCWTCNKKDFLFNLMEQVNKDYKLSSEAVNQLKDLSTDVDALKQKIDNLRSMYGQQE